MLMRLASLVLTVAGGVLFGCAVLARRLARPQAPAARHGCADRARHRRGLSAQRVAPRSPAEPTSTSIPSPCSCFSCCADATSKCAHGRRRPPTWNTWTRRCRWPRIGCRHFPQHGHRGGAGHHAAARRAGAGASRVKAFLPTASSCRARRDMRRVVAHRREPAGTQRRRRRRDRAERSTARARWWCRVERVGEDTRVSGIRRLVERAAVAAPARWWKLTDRIAGWFVAAVLLVALASAAVLVATRAGARAVDCGVGPGGDLSLRAVAGDAGGTDRGRGAARAPRCHRRRVHTPSKRLSKVTHVVFDKTGTLTEGRLCAGAYGCARPGRRPRRAWRWPSALEQGSEHPIATALLAAVRDDAKHPLDAADVRNVPGSGVEGIVEGQRHRLGTHVVRCRPRRGRCALRSRDKRSVHADLAGSEKRWLARFDLADRCAQKRRTSCGACAS